MNNTIRQNPHNPDVASKTLTAHPEWSIKADKGKNVFHATHKATGSTITLNNRGPAGYTVVHDGKIIGQHKDKGEAMAAFKHHFHNVANDLGYWSQKKRVSKGEALDKANIDAGKTKWEKKIARSLRNNRFGTGSKPKPEIGVHHPKYHTKESGVSEAGHHAMIASGNKGRHYAEQFGSAAKQMHRDVIAEQKRIPTPKLPKSEINKSEVNMDTTKILDDAKALLKHLQDNPAELEKLEKKAPKGVNPKAHEKCVKDVKAKGHGVGSAHAICTASMKGKAELEKGILDTAKKVGGAIKDAAKFVGHNTVEDIKTAGKMIKDPKNIRRHAQDRLNTYFTEKAQNKAKLMDEVKKCGDMIAAKKGQKAELEKGILDTAKKVGGAIKDAAKFVGHNTVEDIKTAGKMIKDPKNIKQHAKDRLTTYFTEKAQNKAKLMDEVKKCGDMIAAKKAKKAE